MGGGAAGEQRPYVRPPARPHARTHARTHARDGAVVEAGGVGAGVAALPQPQGLGGSDLAMLRSAPQRGCAGGWAGAARRALPPPLCLHTRAPPHPHPPTSTHPHLETEAPAPRVARAPAPADGHRRGGALEQVESRGGGVRIQAVPAWGEGGCVGCGGGGGVWGEGVGVAGSRWVGGLVGGGSPTPQTACGL